MKTLLRILAAATPMALFGAAGDIKISQMNSGGTAFSDRIFAPVGATQVTNLTTFQTAIGLSSYLPLAGGTMTGNITFGSGLGLVGPSSSVVTFGASGAITITATGGNNVTANGFRISSNDTAIYGATVLNNLALNAAGAVALTAAGTNQNVTVTPSGTGYIVDAQASITNYLGAISGVPTYGALYLAPSGGVSTSNYTIGGSTSDTQLNAPSGGTLYFNLGNSHTMDMTGTRLLVYDTKTIQFGGTAAATIKTSADTTGGVFTFTAPSAGSFAWLPSGGSNAMTLTGGGVLAMLADISVGASGAFQGRQLALCYGNNSSVVMSSEGLLKWATTTGDINGKTFDTGIIRSAANTVKITDAGAGTGNLVAAAATFSGAVTSNTVTSAAATSLILQFGTATAITVSSAGATGIRWNGYGAGALTTDASGNVTAVSDGRLKDIQRSFTRGLSAIRQLKPVDFRWRKESGMETNHDYTGFIAQDVQRVIPEAVMANRDGLLSFSDRPVLAAAVNAINELDAKGRADWWARSIAGLALVLAIRANLKKSK